MRYPSRRIDSTQDSAPIACQCLQCADRQPPTRNGPETLSLGLLPGTPSLASGTAGGSRKGPFPLRPFCSRPLLGRERRGRPGQLLQLRHHGGDATTVSRRGQLQGWFDQRRRGFPGNPQWVQRLQDKHIV